jgi:hypothetical protein
LEGLEEEIVRVGLYNERNVEVRYVLEAWIVELSELTVLGPIDKRFIAAPHRYRPKWSARS